MLTRAIDLQPGDYLHSAFTHRPFAQVTEVLAYNRDNEVTSPDWVVIYTKPIPTDQRKYGPHDTEATTVMLMSKDGGTLLH